MGYFSFSFRVTAIVMSALLLAMPILCQQADVASIARADAERNVNGTTWFIIGVFLGVIGYLVAMLAPPKAPASALIGKSADYIAVYSQVYEETGKKIQMSKAMTGCLVGTGVQLVLVLVLVLAAGSTHYYY